MSDKFLLYSELRTILSDISKQPCGELDPNDDLFEIGVLDSFGIVAFVVSLEKHFNCTIPQEDLIPQNLWSVHAVSETLTKLGVNFSS
jgi:acyl carrier protein